MCRSDARNTPHKGEGRVNFSFWRVLTACDILDDEVDGMVESFI